MPGADHRILQKGGGGGGNHTRTQLPPNPVWQEPPTRTPGLTAFSHTPSERGLGPQPAWGPAPSIPPRTLPTASTDPQRASHGQMHFIGGKHRSRSSGASPNPSLTTTTSTTPPPPRPQPEPLGNRGRSFNLPQTAGWGPFPAGKGRHSLAIPSQSPGSEAGERFLLQTAARRGPASPPPRRSPPDEGRREGPGK